MRLQRILPVCFLLIFLCSPAAAQDVSKYVKPGGGLTPEAQKFLLESRKFEGLTPEEVERGRAELERRKREEAAEAREKEEEEEKEAERIEEISDQERELRYIANKYKDRTLRNIRVLLAETQDLKTVEMELIDALDQYQEKVIRETIGSFQLESNLYRDSSKKLRDIFFENKMEAVVKIKEAAVAASKNDQQASNQTLTTIFQEFTNRVIKEILDTFTLRWAVKDIFRPYKGELPYARPVEELKLFGHEIFTRPPESFAPPTTVPVSEDYLVGPGDEVKVLMWGRIDAEYSLVVNRDGTIQFPRIGTISVAGMTYKEMKRLLKKKAESITGVNISVTMGRLRSITVFVVGEVKNPGAYTVSAFDTVINTLLIAGGPTELGSLRNVQLKRNDKIVTAVDFYDFLLQGETANDRRVQPGDVVFVPQARNLVAIAGNVKRPAIYELRGDLSLNTAISLAGGLAPSAAKQRLQIERSFENRKQVVLDVTYDGRETPPQFTLQDGDIVKVFPIAPENIQAVYAYGNVVRPGSYAYKPGMRVSDVIRDETEVKSDTDFSYALVKRYVEPDMHAELLPFNLGKAILARDKQSNIELEPYDEIYIFNKWLFAYKPYARIKGEIRNPGSYPLKEGMRIKDLIVAGGGLTRDAYLGKSHLFRTDPRTKNVTMVMFNLEKALEDDPENNLLLQDQDRVVVHNYNEYKPKKYVSIYGMVNNPGQYPLAQGMMVRDLIMAGGNLRKGAYKEKAELVRFELVDGDLMKTEILTFNVAAALTGDPQENLELKEYDRVYIKTIPQWLEEITVAIEGEVRHPGEYYVRRGEKLSSLIERAGGFTGQAYLRGAFFTRETAREIQRQRLDDLISRMEQEIAAATAAEVTGALSKEEVEAHRVALEAKRQLLQRLREAKVTGRMVVKLTRLEEFKDSRYDLALEDGDRLTIPRTPQFVNVMGEVYNPTSFLYEEGKKVAYYLNRSGGPTINAEEDEMYIVRADGSVLSKSQSGTFFGWNSDQNRWVRGGFNAAELYPGDTVLVPRKLVKIHWVKETKDITQIIFQIAVTVGVIAAI